jgi:hypothetical protein
MSSEYVSSLCFLENEKCMKFQAPLGRVLSSFKYGKYVWIPVRLTGVKTLIVHYHKSSTIQGLLR